jgi:hypothetical protein
MASQLHQAVELAQSGRRDEARQMFLSYLQTNPDNEVAWLWLASVAITQAEYQHALNQVLRVNPANERAQRLLDDFQRQQYGAPSPPPAPVRTPPPVAPVPPAYSQPYAAEPRPQPQWVPPVEERMYVPPYQEPPRAEPVEVKVKHVGRRGGCLPGVGCAPGCLGCTGCGGPGCLVALLLFAVLPLIILAGLSYSDATLGPLDVVTGYLPNAFGRKVITFGTDTHDISVKVPRSWYLASDQNDMWTFWRDILGTVIPFGDDALDWRDYQIGQLGEEQRFILETNPITLTRAKGVIQLGYQGIVDGSFDCTTVRRQHEQIHEFGSLCGYEQVEQTPGAAGLTFRGIDPPGSIRTIAFFVPITETTATSWELHLPEEAFARFEDDIEIMIQSVEASAR